jgi:hypothetical protein
LLKLLLYHSTTAAQVLTTYTDDPRDNVEVRKSERKMALRVSALEKGQQVGSQGGAGQGRWQLSRTHMQSCICTCPMSCRWKSCVCAVQWLHAVTIARGVETHGCNNFFLLCAPPWGSLHAQTQELQQKLAAATAAQEELQVALEEAAAAAEALQGEVAGLKQQVEHLKALVVQARGDADSFEQGERGGSRGVCMMRQQRQVLPGSQAGRLLLHLPVHGWVKSSV